MEKKWSEMTGSEKRAERFRRWKYPEDANFINDEAKELYEQRVQRLIDVIELREPDRVPVIPPTGYLPAKYSGYTIKEVMYDADKVIEAWTKYIKAFDHDTSPGARFLRNGNSLDLLQPNSLRWAGGGLPDDCDVQIIEIEVLKDDEYDHFMKDRSDFQMRRYLPRSYKVAEPLSKLPPLSSMGMMGGSPAFADPDVLNAFKTLGEAAKMDMEWRKKLSVIDKLAFEMGMPSFSGGLGGGCPFDRIGAMRGLHGMIRDMYRQPERIFEFMDEALEGTMKMLAQSEDFKGTPVMFMALHRGADGWMSEDQFNKFYWPYLKKVVQAFVNEGFVPSLFAEGGYNNRLDTIKELEPGGIIWHLDQTDIFRAKEVLGDRACILGNVSGSMLITCTPEEVKAHCKELIERVGVGGGYILSYGVTPNQAPIENIIAMRDSAKEFGVYKK